MKPFHKSIYKRYVRYILICILILTANCTDDFESINTDPSRLTSLTAEDIKSLFPTALYQGLTHGGGNQQTAQNLFADHYAQYFAGTATYFASHRYVIVQEWIMNQWIGLYVNSMPSVYMILQETKDDEALVCLNAVARIWKVFLMHRTTDYYGPVPYSQMGSKNTVIQYDAQKDIYYDLFKELTEAAALLKDNFDKQSYGERDLVYHGDNELWYKFANTLRLRLAMRISNVEPGKAKQEAEAAVSLGVLEDVSEDALFKTSPFNINRLNATTDWDEFRMSATMESLLKGFNDPRLSVYFAPAKETGLFRGVRSGMLPAEQTLQENRHNNASNVGERFQVQNRNTTPEAVMYSAEAYLLRAEGALKGWSMGGTAQEFYEKGIEMSMLQFGITDPTVISDYINGETLPMAPGGYFNTPALTDIPVKFSGDPAKQYEQILTQKWLALFPDGFEAWAEIRRTGFPKTYPLIHSENPDIEPDEMISRITFPVYDKERNGPAIEGAISLLGGQDKVTTKLWWDTN